jgi:hypothetical protein
MKFLFFFLSLFMLYMSCLPCGDTNTCNAKAPAEISATDNHQQHKHDSDICSPFCTCACCATSVLYSAFYKEQAIKVVAQSEKYPLYNIAFTTQAASNIWQPPKLS